LAIDTQPGCGSSVSKVRAGTHKEGDEPVLMQMGDEGVDLDSRMDSPVDLAEHAEVRGHNEHR
jgi:hypothetical protein